jgi:iron complex outermembrane receptor protein/vitamin B12 transporter
MSRTRSRIAAFRCACLLAGAASLTSSAKAVVVRGKVTDTLGYPVAGAKISLIQGKATVAAGLSGPDGTYEISSGLRGRFLLLTTSLTFAPNISQDFYGGRTAVVARQIVLNPASLTQQVTVTASGIPTPLEQTSAAVTLIPQDDLLDRVGILDELRQSPGVAVVQTGQYGGVTTLFVRGGNSDSNKVLIDGIPAEDVGGVFDYGTISSTGFSTGDHAAPAIELYRGPNSALFGTDSQASVVQLTTQRGSSPRPVFTYSGDAGNLHTWRDEAVVSGAHRELDYFAAFSRFDTSNALPEDRFHSATSAANLGYTILTNTLLRFTLRNADSGAGLPNAHDFYGISQDGQEKDQDLYSGATLENRFHGNWHNLVRYGIARKREQANYFGQQGTLVTIPSFYGPYQAYVGDLVTIRGANGYTAAGQAQLYGDNYDQDSNRDELYYQSDYTFPHRIVALFGFRYENERGSFNLPAFGEQEQIARRNFEYNLQLQGDIKSRLFYSVGGSLQKNHLFGIAGTPRVGLAYIPVRPSAQKFHGTKIRVNIATGVQEPSLAAQYESLFTELQQAGDITDIAAYRIGPLGPERSRTLDIGADQNILGEKLIAKLGYFHNRFSHQLEYVQAGDIQNYFGIAPTNDPYLYGADLNSLAFRADGLEFELQYQPLSHLFLHGGYTYLDTVVSDSFASDATAARQGNPTVNPNLPGIAIGADSPLVGARPFRRPPHTGFFAVQYTGKKFSTAIQGALASRADDSTFLGGDDTTLSGNTLLLPNRDLDFGYLKLDLGLNYAASKHVTVFTQLNNLLNGQHIGPIGYPGLPFTVRSGLKIRLGGE